MSLLSNITDAVGITSPSKAPVSIEEIEAKIASARVRIVQLQSDHARECLRWADTGDATERDKLADQLATARVDLASLQSALSMAKQRNSQLERERLAGLNASRLRSCTMHLRAMETAAAELSAAVEKAAHARRKMHAAAVKARTSAPSAMPKGSLTEASVIDGLIAHEFHRLSYDPSVKGKPSTGGLPGAKPPTLWVKDDPASIPALVDQLKQAHDWAITVLKGEIATPLAEAQTDDKAKLIEQPVSDQPEVIGEFNPADLQPGTRTAAEIMAGMRKVSFSVDNK